MKPDTNSGMIKIIVNSFLAKRDEVHELLTPYVEDWLTIEAKTNVFLDEGELDQTFYLNGLTTGGPEDTLVFKSEDWWDEIVYDHHSGHELHIPLSFFDDPKPHHDKADQVLKDREAKKQESNIQSKREMIARLQSQIARLEAN